MDQKFVDLYDEYTHAPLPRREFLARFAQLAGGAAAAAALLPLLEANYAIAQVAAGDERLETGYITYPGASGEMRAYRARPKAEGKLPGVVVIHENRGLNPHIEDVARRAAVAGFLAIAPDALSPLGGTPDDTDEARQKIRQLDRAKTLQDFVAAVSFLKTQPDCTGKVGCVGFCWGGSMSNQLAVNAADLSAAVVFYGSSPRAEDVSRIKVPLLLNYAGLDQRINSGVPAYEEALKAAGVQYAKHIYEGVNHAFHNDTSARRYNEAAAKLAWQRTIDFFNRTLK